VFGAWVTVDWYGSIKPSTDMFKQVKASNLLVEGGYSTRAREARITTGTKFSKNVKRLKRENEQLAEAIRPTLELEREFGPDAAAGAMAALQEKTESMISLVEDLHDGSS
jgi:capsid protein